MLYTNCFGVMAVAVMLFACSLLNADAIYVSTQPPSVIDVTAGQMVYVQYDFSSPDFITNVSGTINWGDGTAALPFSQSGNSQTLGMAANHSYSVPGVYDLSMSATGSSYSIQTEVVGYDEVQVGTQFVSTGPFGEGYYEPIYADEPTYGNVAVHDSDSSLNASTEVVVSGSVAPLPSTAFAGVAILGLCGAIRLCHRRRLAIP